MCMYYNHCHRATAHLGQLNILLLLLLLLLLRKMPSERRHWQQIVEIFEVLLGTCDITHCLIPLANTCTIVFNTKSLHFTKRCLCMLLHVTACYCMLLYVTECYCMLLSFLTLNDNFYSTNFYIFVFLLEEKEKVFYVRK
jgi:hypothetical protein